MTAHERRIRVDGDVELAVREFTSDATQPPVLLVHGLASNARTWDGVAAELAAAGHPVAAVDQRGHGRSDKPDTGYDFATVAADLAAVIDALGFPTPLVAGQSWGGNVVLELAIRHPEATRAVACIDGGTIEVARQFPTFEAARKAMTPPRLLGLPARGFEAELRRARPDWSESAIAGTMASFEVRPDGTIAPWLTLDRHMAIVAELWGHHPSQRYSLVGVPVLLVPSATAGRPSVAVAERALPRCRVQAFAGADHDIHAQLPREVGALLHDATIDGFFR